MKKKVKIVMGAAAVLLIGLIGFCTWFLSGSGSTEYYAQIDNSKVEQVDTKGGVISFKGNLRDLPGTEGRSLYPPDCHASQGCSGLERGAV